MTNGYADSSASVADNSLLKEVAKDRLVVWLPHELAHRYATVLLNWQMVG